MKNCVSLVSAPELAMANWPEPVKATDWLNSSGNGVLKTAAPLDVLSTDPPWKMKSEVPGNPEAKRKSCLPL